MRPYLKLCVLTVLSCVFHSALFAQAQWTGGAGDANWDSILNWSSGLPAAGADVEFATGLSSGTVIDTNGDRTVGVLNLDNSGAGVGAFTIYGAGDTLNIQGGLNYTGSSGNIDLGSSAGSANDFTVNVGAFNQAWSILSGSLYLEGNLTGTADITKSGGNLRMGGNNSGFSGNWFIQSGNINISFRAPNQTAADNTFGTGTVTLAGNGANISLNRSSDVTIANHIINDVASGDPSFRYSGGAGSGGVFNLTGLFSTGMNARANSRLPFSAKMGFGGANNFNEGRYVLSGDWSGYTPGGSSLIATGEGTLQIDAAQALANSSITYTFNGTSTDAIDPTSNSLVEAGITTLTSKLIFNNDVTTVANNINFANATAAPPAWVGESMQSVGTHVSSGMTDVSGNVNIANVNAVRNNLFSEHAGATLRVSGVISSSGNSGNELIINDRYTYAYGKAKDPVSGKELAWRNPKGTVEFTGANTYSISTIVEAGTFKVNNSTGSATGSGDVSILSGATLGGAGTLGDGGAVVVTLQGILSPGNSPGTLTMDLGSGELDISAAESLVYELGSSSDQVLLSSGNLNIGNNAIGFSSFTFSDSGGLGVGSYTLFDTSESITGTLNAADLSGSVGSFTGTLEFANSNQDLVLTVIPEPSTFLLLIASSVFGILMHRRRH